MELVKSMLTLGYLSVLCENAHFFAVLHSHMRIDGVILPSLEFQFDSNAVNCQLKQHNTSVSEDLLSPALTYHETYRWCARQK
jgi:hypothetical protein